MKLSGDLHEQHCHCIRSMVRAKHTQMQPFRKEIYNDKDTSVSLVRGSMKITRRLSIC